MFEALSTQKPATVILRKFAYSAFLKGKRKYHKFATFDVKNVKNIRFFM